MTAENSHTDALMVLRELSKWAAGLSTWRDEPKGPYLRDIIADARRTIAADRTCCPHGIHWDNACGACIPPRGTRVVSFTRSAFRNGSRWTTFNVRTEDADEAERRLRAVYNAPALPRGACDCGTGLPDSEGGEM